MFAMLRKLFAGPAASASVDEAASMMASGAILVDVREDSEWNAGHARGALHVPLGEIQGGGLQALERRGLRVGDGDSVLLICRSGMRSSFACRALGAGTPFKTINVRGGMNAWQRAGLPMEGGR